MAATLLAASVPASGADRTRVPGGLNAPGLSTFDAPPSSEEASCADEVPDPTGAIGPRHYVEAVNSCIGIYDRGELEPVREVAASAFWGPVLGGEVLLADPQVVWDRAARRWYMVMLNVGGLPDGVQLLFAWSKTADPNDLDGGWCRHAISTGVFDDFPNLGYSRRHIIIGTNVRLTGDAGFSRVWAIAKPRDGDTTCGRPRISAFGSADAPLRQGDGRRASTPVPVNPVRPSKRGYVIAADCLKQGAGDGDEEEEEEGCRRTRSRGSEITVWALAGRRGSPRLVKEGVIDVPAYRIPDSVPQPGTDRVLDPLDTRLTQAVSNTDPTRDGRNVVWTQHAVRGRNGRAEVRWYELDPKRLSIVRHGTIARRHYWTWNAAISPTTRGDGAVVNYNVGSGRLLPQIRASSRGPGDPSGAMGGEVVLGGSVAPTEDCLPPPDDSCRWGDYAGATPDPRRANVVWGSNQLIGRERLGDPEEGHWLTRNFALVRRR